MNDFFTARSNKLYRFVQPLTPWQRYGGTALVTCSFIGIWFFCHHASAMQQIGDCQQKLTQDNELAKRMAQLHCSCGELAKQIKQELKNKNVQGQKEPPASLLDLITNAAKDANLEIRALHPNKPQRKGTNIQESMRATFVGPNAQVTQFFDLLAEKRTSICGSEVNIEQLFKDTVKADCLLTRMTIDHEIPVANTHH